MALCLVGNTGRGQMWVGLSSVMSKEAPIPPAPSCEAAQSNHGHPNSRPFKVCKQNAAISHYASVVVLYECARVSSHFFIPTSRGKHTNNMSQNKHQCHGVGQVLGKFIILVWKPYSSLDALYVIGWYSEGNALIGKCST